MPKRGAPMDGMISSFMIKKTGFKAVGCGFKMNAAGTGSARKKAFLKADHNTRSTNPPVHASSIVLATTGTIERSPCIFGNPMPDPELSGRSNAPGESTV